MTKYQRHLARTRAIQRRRRFDRDVARALAASTVSNPDGSTHARAVVRSYDVHVWTWPRKP